MFYSYHVHGLSVQSNVSCHWLMQISKTTIPDITISRDKINLELDSLKLWSALKIKDQILLKHKQIGKFLISNGNRITVDLLPNISDTLICKGILNYAIPCAIHQRILLPLHANAFVHKEKAILVLAKSGVGKSTLAAAMQNRGYDVLSDDLCVVKIKTNTQPLVFPGTPRIGLKMSAINFLNKDINCMKKIKKNKYAIKTNFYTKPIEIKYVYIFEKNKKTEPILSDLSDLNFIKKVHLIQNHVYRKQIMYIANIEALNFKLCAKLAEKVIIKHISRPENRTTIDELANLLENDLN